MINVFVVKKYAAFTIAAMLPTVLFYVGLTYYGLWGGIGFLLGGLLLALILGVRLISNPFTQMLEGKGILSINLDSTGIMHPFITAVQSPFISGKFHGRQVNDVFDRNIVNQIAPPIVCKDKAVYQNGKLYLPPLDEQEFNKNRFVMFHYPVLLYNAQNDSFITKDFLSEQEKDTFAEHGILYLNRKVQDLTTVVRDFGRYVVELTKPQDKWYKNKWVIIIAIILIGILIAALFPKILEVLGGAASSTTSAFSGVSGTITPRG